MAERSRIFDDIAGMAGGAFSTLAGIGDEVGAIVRARLDEALGKLQLVRREEFEAVSELAANARDEAEQVRAQLAGLEARIAAFEQSRHAVPPAAGTPPGASGTEHAAPHEHPSGGAPGGPPPRAETTIDGGSNRADEIPTTD